VVELRLCYLIGDNATAVAAADRALALSPDQFTLYLNRALARLSDGDVAGSRADVATALEVASRSRLDSNAWFFAQTDYDLGRLATLRPADAGELLAMQGQVRAAAIAQRIGRPVGPADGPALGPIRLVTLTLGPDARLAEGRVIEPGVALPVASADGLRISIAGAAIPDGTVVSVRVRENGIEQPAYRVDRPWRTGALEMVFGPRLADGTDRHPDGPERIHGRGLLDAVTKAETAFRVTSPGAADRLRTSSPCC
jgi:hypothetical protein